MCLAKACFFRESCVGQITEKKRIKNPQKVSYFLHPKRESSSLRLEKSTSKRHSHTPKHIYHLEPPREEAQKRNPVQKVITTTVFLRTI